MFSAETEMARVFYTYLSCVNGADGNVRWTGHCV